MTASSMSNQLRQCGINSITQLAVPHTTFKRRHVESQVLIRKVTVTWCACAWYKWPTPALFARHFLPTSSCHSQIVDWISCASCWAGCCCSNLLSIFVVSSPIQAGQHCDNVVLSLIASRCWLNSQWNCCLEYFQLIILLTIHGLNGSSSYKHFFPCKKPQWSWGHNNDQVCAK